MTMTLPLELQQEARLRAAAQAKGVTPDALVREALDHVLTRQQTEEERPMQTAADIVLERMRKVPPEVMAGMPRDGASQHDHYIYGWPKKDA